MSFNEELKKAKDSLKTLLTADNTETVTGIDAVLDSLSAEHKKAEDKIGELQETVVKYVRNTSFKTPSEEDPAEGDTKNLDELLSDTLDKIIEKRSK